jgi:hypothetical protein
MSPFLLSCFLLLFMPEYRVRQVRFIPPKELKEKTVPGCVWVTFIGGDHSFKRKFDEDTRKLWNVGDTYDVKIKMKKLDDDDLPEQVTLEAALSRLNGVKV